LFYEEWGRFAVCATTASAMVVFLVAARVVGRPRVAGVASIGRR
jgi:hypothetical protein